MAIRTNPELDEILSASPSQYAQVRDLDNALTSDKRIKAKRHPVSSTPQASVWDTGTLFRDAALIGPFVFDGVDIVEYGITSDLTTCLAADLTTGTSVLRIEGGGHWIEGTVGLEGSNADFIFSENPTANNSIAISSTLRLRANPLLPDGIPDVTPPEVSVTPATSTVTSAGNLQLTANATDNKEVTRVEFYRDGILLTTKVAAPWTYDDPLTFMNKGTRVYSVKAYDAAGNVTTSAVANVNVNIPPPVETGPAVPVGSQITDFSVENLTGSAQVSVPLTFAQPFKVGEVPSNSYVELVASDSTVIPCQMDARAFHGDGSVRHAVISAIIPTLNASETKTFGIRRKGSSTTPSPAVPSDFSSLNATVSITEAGVVYTASLATLLQGSYTTWLSGDVVSEWEVATPLKTSGGAEHADLHVRFYVRAYKGQNKARVDISVENTWAWNPSPRDVTYDALMTIDGVQVFSKTAIVHHPRTRYRNVFWWNTNAPQIHVKHNIQYMLATKAVPNYDLTVVPDATAATTYKNNTVTNGGPMGRGTARASQGGPGGRPDMGILPGWAVLYLISMNKDAKEATLNQGNQAGSWSIHFRDKNTGRVLSFNNYPHFALTGTAGDNTNPATGLSEKAPTIVSNTNTNLPDVSHHPDQAYVPYLVTGDIYYLEELQFWAQYCVINQNSHPAFRNGAKGLLFIEQVRGLAWGLRSVAHAAYISPAGTKKSEFEYILQSNIEWLDNRYTNSTASDTKLGALIHSFAFNQGYTVVKATGQVNGIAPWMDDHFTSVIGRCAELGYSYVLPHLAWKSKYTVGRLYGAPGYCWIQAASFVHRVREGGNTTPIYTSLAEVYANTMSPDVIAAQQNGCATQEMATAWGNINTWTGNGSIRTSFDGVSNPIVGDMDGYSDSPSGYPSNLQAAIAYCATHKTTNSANAWEVFESRTVKPSYSAEPQFAIVPRP